MTPPLPPNRPPRPGESGVIDVFATVATRALAMEDIARALASSEEIGEMSRAFLPIVANAVRSGESCLLLAQGGDTFEIAGHHGYAADQEALLEESLVEQAAASVAGEAERPVTRDAVLEDESFRAWCAEQGLENAAARPWFELYAPLRVQDQLVAVLALGRRRSGYDFSDEDILFVEHVADSVALAVRRCILARENAEKLHVLRELARFSREITSTLDPGRVLQTVANTTEAVIERDRAVVALVESGRLRIRAVSEKLTVEKNEDEVLGLTEVLGLLQVRGVERRVTAEGLEDEVEDPSEREVYARFFEQGEMQSLLALPLRDEEGQLGFLILESRDPSGFADAADKENLEILSGAVTIAVRNAELYRRLPMVGLLSPIASLSRRWNALSPRRRAIAASAGGALLLLVAAVPLPRDMAGPATVRPSEVFPVTVTESGVVQHVYVHAGDAVSVGTPVAAVRNRETDARLEAAEADYALARQQAAEAAARRDQAEARRYSLEARNLAAWSSYARSVQEELRLVSRVAGLVATPRVEEKVGERLEQGDVLCEIARLDPVHVEVRLREEDVGLIAEGAKARFKVLAFPDRQFVGRVLRISPQATSEPGRPATVVVWVECANPNLALLSGMTGRAKIQAGRSPILLDLLRPVVRLIRMNFWM